MGELAKGVTSIFKPKMPDMPEMPGAVKQADIMDPKAMEARKRKMQEEQTKGGRDSTMLSGTPSTYSSTQLG